MPQHTTLIATLGGQPQKITFLLDLLLAHGEKIDQVILVYISSYERSRKALRILEQEFSGGCYRGAPCRLKRLALRGEHADLVDIRSAEEVEAARRAIQQLLSELKSENQCVHMGLSGGRRLISMLALTEAMQYLTPVDHLWHVHVSPELQERSHDGRLLHLEPGEAIELLPVPFVPWVSYFPALSNLMKRSPRDVEATARGWLDEPERERCARVWQALSRRQQQVLQAFAAGAGRQGAARQLNISVTTVDSHRERIVAQCRLAWGETDPGQIDLKFLERRFGPYLAALPPHPDGIS